MNKILNYTILEKLEETRDSRVYRARKDGEEEENKKTFRIKVLKPGNPTLWEIARFRQEYERIRKIDSSGVIKTYALLEYDNSIALVLEDFNGISLKRIFKDKNINLNLKLFLRIAIKLSSALGFLHKENIVHKSIKPHNILFNAHTEELKITNFGISNEITHEDKDINKPAVIEGILVYLSPEQTGRMNRQPDYRTDMYSLGITFYEILTGSVPFVSKDPMEVLYHHIAIEEKPLSEWNSSIPNIVSNIVTKLLSKMPEERYRNCYGLMSDLKECLKQLETTGIINEFELSQHDISPIFTIPRILAGREKEINILMNTVRRACSAGERSEILLVTGHPGIGKSALIHESRRSIMSKHGYFIPGKYDQFRRDVPYSALIRAFQGLVNRLLAESSQKIEHWKKNFLDALAPNGKVITDVIPEIELIIGEQPEIPELGPEQNQNRFNYVFGNFAAVLATEDHPVVLFLDDLQWVDTASLDLIKLIITDKDIKHFLLIGAYRNNEVEKSHPLMKTLDTIKENGVPINSIHLDILDIESVNEMVSLFLRREKENSLPLAKLVLRKTNGNPFFVNQFMKNLYDENLLELDPLAGWQWKMDQIEEMRIPGIVVELMAQKITKLPESGRELMKICACFGNSFDPEIISGIYNRSIEETVKEITYALNEGMLRVEDDRYQFQHDRIQEAAYSLIPEEEKAKLHYRIGSLMLKTTKEEELQDKILYIVDHLNAGRTLAASEDERYNLARLNLRSGNKAKASAAYESALIYFKTGIELINFAGRNRMPKETGWEKQYELSLSLYTNAAEAAYLFCDYDEMEGLCAVVLERAKSLPHTVAVYEIKIRAYIAQNRLLKAIDVGTGALKLFGTSFPKKPGSFHMMLGLVKTGLLLRGKNTGNLLELPRMNDPLMQGAMRLLAAISTAAYWAQPGLLPPIIFKTIEITIKYGNSTESPPSYCAYGFLLCSMGKIDPGHEFGKLGLTLLERMNIKKSLPVLFAINGLLRQWKEHSSTGIESLRMVFQMGLEIGDFEFAAYSAATICSRKFFCSF
ncbi:MAG: serine/threonine-protein kinase PknK, partial [bacterium]|nr:serine/threonine-protein kinase PknK [bacterium]